MRLGALTANELANGGRPVIFAELEFDSGLVNLHTDLGLLTVLGKDWEGVGSLAGVSQLSETTSLAPASLALQVSGLTAEIIAPAFGESYQLRPCRLYMGAKNKSSAALAEDPTEIWSGTMEQIAGTLGNAEGDTLGIICESEIARLDRSSNRLLADASHQSEHPGSLFFQYQNQVEDASPAWNGRGGTPIRGRSGNASSFTGRAIG